MMYVVCDRCDTIKHVYKLFAVTKQESCAIGTGISIDGAAVKLNRPRFAIDIFQTR